MNPLSQKFLCQFGGKLKSSLYTSLISYWKLGEATGAARADSFGTNTLTNNNNVSQVTGVGGAGLASGFASASSQYLSIASNATLQMGAGVRMSVAGWLNMTTNANGTPLSKWTAAGNNKEYQVFVTTGGTKAQLSVSSAGTVSNASVTNGTAIVPGTWYFIWAYYDGANIGISVNNNTPVTAAFSADIFSGTSQFAFGEQNLGSFLNGSLEAWGLWKRVLTAAEVTALYNGGVVLPYPW